MLIVANIWKHDDTDGQLYEGQRVEVERSDQNEVGVHLRIASHTWGTSFYLTAAMAGALAAELLRAAEEV